MATAAKSSDMPADVFPHENPQEKREFLIVYPDSLPYIL